MSELPGYSEKDIEMSNQPEVISKPEREAIRARIQDFIDRNQTVEAVQPINFEILDDGSVVFPDQESYLSISIPCSKRETFPPEIVRLPYVGITFGIKRVIAPNIREVGAIGLTSDVKTVSLPNLVGTVHGFIALGAHTVIIPKLQVVEGNLCLNQLDSRSSFFGSLERVTGGIKVRVPESIRFRHNEPQKLARVGRGFNLYDAWEDDAKSDLIAWLNTLNMPSDVSDAAISPAKDTASADMGISLVRDMTEDPESSPG